MISCLILRRLALALMLVTGESATTAGAQPMTAAQFSAVVSEGVPVEPPFTAVDAMRLDQQFIGFDPRAAAGDSEQMLGGKDWVISYPANAGPVLSTAVDVFRKDVKMAFGVDAIPSRAGGLKRLAAQPIITVTTLQETPGCAQGFLRPEDYRLEITYGEVHICGHTERGAKSGLYNLLLYFKLKEAPILPAELDVTRLARQDRRMTLTGVGWMDWPDAHLETLSKYGFNAIYASVYANTNGSPAPPLYPGFRSNSPGRVNDLVYRAGLHGIDVFAPLLFDIRNDGSDESRLRALIQDTLKQTPAVKGYVLLIEGFYYKELPKWDWDPGKAREWTDIWTKMVSFAASEFKALKPTVEVLAWDYNIDYRPEAVALKKRVIDGYNDKIVPMITWENGKRTRIGDEDGYVKDYSISETGPSEAAIAQMEVARARGMKVYAKADTWASWQFGTSPYIPVPEQWNRRYQLLADYKVDGTLESWMAGFSPNFVAELRAWQSWTNAPEFDALLNDIAVRMFGRGSPQARNAWRKMSEAIRAVPDTGPYMSTNTAVSAPFFLDPPLAKAMTFTRSNQKLGLWSGNLLIDPSWPYGPYWFKISPDFANKKRQTDIVTRPFSTPSFVKQNRIAIEAFEDAMVDYRSAAMSAPDEKRISALKEVMLAEQMLRMLSSTDRLLEFEELRFTLSDEMSDSAREAQLSRMRDLISQEAASTREALVAAERDSRLGYYWSYDYMYSPSILKEKLVQLQGVLDTEIPAHMALQQGKPDKPVAISVPPKYSTLPRARFSFEIGPPVTLQCNLNNSGFAPCRNPHVIRILKEGPQRLEVVAIWEGNRRSSPMIYEWVVDAAPPFDQ